jgi:hypothetical protein
MLIEYLAWLAHVMKRGFTPSRVHIWVLNCVAHISKFYGMLGGRGKPEAGDVVWHPS